jgi:cold shock CspA family protein
MTTEHLKPLKIFCSYSHRDEEYLNELRTWLRGLERRGFIQWWHDREITPGWEWEETIDKNLRTADVILLLVSPAFMGSDYVFEREISKAVERHERGEARVIPIIVRPADWEWPPLNELQALPRDAKPITTWTNQDEAWLDVVRGIRRATEEFSAARRERAAKEQYRKALDAAWADRELSDAEAQRLDALASELSLSIDTAAGIERDAMGDTKETVLERQEQAAREKERKERLKDLYGQARKLHQNQEWQAVINVFERIRAEDPDYPDHAGILGSAREALEKAWREDTLRRYREAVEWAWMDEQLSERDAQKLSTFAIQLNVSRSDASAIERKVMGETKEEIVERQGRAAKEKERAAKERLESLYDLARRMYEIQEWLSVIHVFEQIHEEQPDFPDPEGLLAAAQEALPDRVLRVAKFRKALEETERKDQGAKEQTADELRATDAAKQMAEELGVNLSRVEGSGALGRITVRDVQGLAKTMEREVPRERGRVKWFDAERGYGFLVRPTGDDLFVHHSEVQGDPSELSPSGEVEYEVVRNDRRPSARSVKLTNQPN